MTKLNERGNFEVYDDPVLYDIENQAITEDIKFISKWAKGIKGTIIDFACGTGRATIPLAKEGHDVIGVDIHKPMIEEAKKKAELEALNVEWVLQDCTQLHLNVEAELVYSVGHSFQHFLTNEAQDGFFDSARRHLYR